MSIGRGRLLIGRTVGMIGVAAVAVAAMSPPSLGDSPHGRGLIDSSIEGRLIIDLSGIDGVHAIAVDEVANPHGHWNTLAAGLGDHLNVRLGESADRHRLLMVKAMGARGTILSQRPVWIETSP